MATNSTEDAGPLGTTAGRLRIIQQEHDGTLREVNSDEFDMDAPAYVFIGIESMLPKKQD